MQVYTDDPIAVAIVQSAFPQYRHAPSRLRVMEFHPIKPTSYWSGGSRDYWSIAKLDGTGSSDSCVENGSGFTADVPEITDLPPGCALVRWTNGPRTFACLYVKPENLAKMLPAPVELSREQTIVLVCSSGLTSAGRKERLQEIGLSQPQIDQAKADLVTKRLMTKIGAVTTDGRNAANAVAIKNDILHGYNVNF